MNKWLARFLDDTLGNRPDKPDIVPQIVSVSGMSGPFSESQPENPGLLAGDLVCWEGPDGKQRGPASVDFLHTEADGTVWAFVTLPEKGWAAVNLKYATLSNNT